MQLKKLLFALIFLLGCAKGDDYPAKFASYQLLLPNLLGDGQFLIIPAEGCSTCLATAFEFLEAQHQDHRIRFVVVARQRRAATMKLSKAAVSSPNVIIDEKNLAGTSGVASTSPMLVEVQNGLVVKHTQLQPGNIQIEFAHLLRRLGEDQPNP
jgi:hypothetical protein